MKGKKQENTGTFATVSIRFFDLPGDWPVSIAHEVIPANGGDIPFVMHERTAEFVYILAGEATACVGGKTFAVSAGDHLIIPAGAKHRFVTGAVPLTAISVFQPSMTFENIDAVTLERGEDAK